MFKRTQTKTAMWGRIFLTACALILGASLAFAGPHKISKDLEVKHSASQVNVIVQFNQVPTSYHHEKILRRGGKINRDLGRFRGGAYSMPASELASLAADPEVLYISPDRPVRSTSSGTATAALDYHTDTVNAPAAWAQGLDGTGVGVAVIDSGIANVADLNVNNVIYSQDFTGLGSVADQYGHGTHVAGIIAGTGASSGFSNDFYTFKGVAGNASLINLRVLDQNGAGSDSEVIAAIQTAIQLQSTYNIRVISLSVGRPVFESYTVDPLCQAVEQAWDAGIVVVVAAGNYGRDNAAGTNGYGTITAPGNDPYVITVGATNAEGTADRTDDVPASYSSKGPSLFDNVVKPDLVAPGNAIISLYTPGDTLDQELPGNEVPLSLFQTNGSNASSGTYFVLSGTSMATPLVSGAAALMLQQNPALTPDQIKARLMKTAFKNLVQSATATDATTGQTYTVQADIFTVGAGELDIQAALANTDLAPATAGSAVSPTAAVDSNGDVTLVTGSSILGSGSDVILWGTSAVWGNDVILWGTDAPGSDVILWGTDAPGSDVILWGTSTPITDVILWGTDAPGSDVILWGTSAPGSDLDVILWGTDLPGSDVILWGTSTPQAIRDK
jgi:serine protease AprX